LRNNPAVIFLLWIVVFLIIWIAVKGPAYRLVYEIMPSRTSRQSHEAQALDM
jgi:hypothetical protein